MQACCVLLEKKLWAEAEAAFTNKQAHRKFKICLACLFPILLSVLCVFVYYSASSAFTVQASDQSKTAIFYLIQVNISEPL